jgi:YD repeat-containing protein
MEIYSSEVGVIADWGAVGRRGTIMFYGDANSPKLHAAFQNVSKALEDAHIGVDVAFRPGEKNPEVDLSR